MQNVDGYNERWSWKALLLNCEELQNCIILEVLVVRVFGRMKCKQWMAYCESFWTCWGFYSTSCIFLTYEKAQVSLHLLFWTFVCTLLLLFFKCKCFFAFEKAQNNICCLAHSFVSLMVFPLQPISTTPTTHHQ